MDNLYASLSFFKAIFVVLVLLCSSNQPIKAQDTLDVVHGKSAINSNTYWLQFSDAPNALYHHIAGQAYDLLDNRVRSIAELPSLAEWQARQKEVKETLMNIVGPFPEKTPLHAKITKSIDKEGYQIENIIYQSQPSFYVTASLFIPDGVNKPAPAIIYTSGHTKDAYRDPDYQHVILNLVKKGFVVFAFDPIGQGERVQYYNPSKGGSSVGGSTNGHSYSGAQAFITGSSQARFVIWDGIRAVDYLLSRKDLVDPDRVGITGRSGGGTQAAYIGAFDDRIYAEATEGWITSFTRLFQSIGPQDAEQNLPGQIARGLDHADFLEVRAPKPTLMLTSTRGYFSIQGARETAKEASRIYKAYGKEDNFGKVEADAVHQSAKKNRVAMYGFFQKHLENPGSSKDEKVKLLSKQDLQVTHTGQVSTALNGETIFNLNRKQAKKEEKALQSSRQDLSQYLPGAIKAAKELSGYQNPDPAGQPVFTGRFQKDGYVIEKYFINGEGGNYPIPYLLFVPDKPNGKALIYLSPAGKTAQFQQEQRLAQQGITVLAPDLLGVGEMGGGDLHGDSYIKGANYNMWFASILIGRSIVGIQAGDIVKLARLLQKRAGIQEIAGLARRQLGPVLLHAAAFDSSIARIGLIKPYSSYCSIAENRFYNPAYIPSSVAGAIEGYDLPDLAASLAPRKLLIAEIRDGTGQPAESEAIEKYTASIKAAYQLKHARRQLKIISQKSVTDPHELVIDWMK